MPGITASPKGNLSLFNRLHYITLYVCVCLRMRKSVLLLKASLDQRIIRHNSAICNTHLLCFHLAFLETQVVTKASLREAYEVKH